MATYTYKQKFSEFVGTHKKVYRIGNSIGRGGEGEVFEVEGDISKLIKIYHSNPDAIKEEKLRRMVEMRHPDLEKYTSWPIDFCVDAAGRKAIIIKKLSGCVPLHCVFTPMDRKKFFPGTKYDFLIHIAYNLSVAFTKIHRCGVIIGDVNEGNVLVDKNGFVYFIDCDSFQIENGSRLYHCDVGVPRYTAPEILIRQSFRGVKRTVNTDSFSLAVLIFQLVFLGKHPFAGAPIGDATIDNEEDAIRLKQFPYSQRKTDKKLKPPQGSLSLDKLPKIINEYFHQAFEEEAKRPEPEQWAAGLKVMMSGLKPCTSAKAHVYPNVLNQCPWCDISRQFGIVYFLDDALGRGFIANRGIEDFVNGFRVEKMRPELPSSTSKAINNTSKAFNKTLVQQATILNRFLLFATIVCLIIAFVYPWVAIMSVVLMLFLYLNPLSMRARSNIRTLRETIGQKGQHQKMLEEELQNLPQVEFFNKTSVYIGDLVTTYRSIPQKLQEREKMVDEEIYEQQLQDFLKQFLIKDAAIPNFGPSRKQALNSRGIRTAADVPKLRKIKVDGIGPSLEQDVMRWYRQIKTRFNYQRNEVHIGARIAQIRREFRTERDKLEQEILSKAGGLHSCRDAARVTVNNRRNTILYGREEIAQMKFDMETYRNPLSIVKLFGF